jgi:hypothetical protein
MKGCTTRDVTSAPANDAMRRDSAATVSSRLLPLLFRSGGALA